MNRKGFNPAGDHDGSIAEFPVATELDRRAGRCGCIQLGEPVVAHR